MRSDQSLLLEPIGAGVLGEAQDSEGLLFLRRLAMSGRDARWWRDSLLARYPMPATAEDEVVLESVLFRVASYRHAIGSGRQKLTEWFSRTSPVEYAISDRGWIAIMEYLSGLSGLDRCAEELRSGGGVAGSLHGCRALLAVARVGVSLVLPGTMPRDCLFGWLAVGESTLRENCAGYFRRCALELPRGSVPDSVDPVTWAGEILRTAEELLQEQSPDAAWSWMESEFRMSSLLAPIDVWVAQAVAREAGMVPEVVPVLTSAFKRRSEIRTSDRRKETLLLDIASKAGFPASDRVLAAAHRILEFQVPEQRLYEPLHLVGGSSV